MQYQLGRVAAKTEREKHTSERGLPNFAQIVSLLRSVLASATLADDYHQRESDPIQK
jgi:hypothetical protein